MLRVLDLNNSTEWDRIVTSFLDYDVYYLSGYVKGFALHGDGEPLLFYCEDGETRGINVVMKRDIAKAKRLVGKIDENRFFDFATPYGYGGWLIENRCSSSFFTEYFDWCQNHSIVSEFVRFHPVLKNHVFSRGAYEIVPLGKTVSIDTTDKETIWGNFSGKNRNVIRKAVNNSVEIKQGLTEQLLDSFMDIYNQTMIKDNADQYYFFEKPFYETLLTDLKQHATVFYAVYNCQIIASAIILFANKKLNYHLSGSLKEFQHLAPTNMLLWKAAEWGSETGCKSFHLGGGVGSSEDNLFRFKKAFFRGELCQYHIGTKVFNDKLYSFLLERAGACAEGSFFPKYRANSQG